MPDKPNLTLINMKPLDNLPKEGYDDFRQLILHDGLKPSKALHEIMENYQCDEIHVTSIVRLVEHTYPDLDITRQDFRFRVVDSAYPKNQEQFSDKDFDDGIAELLALPPIEY